VNLIGNDQRITSGPAVKRPHSKAEYMTAPERFADSQFLSCTAGAVHTYVFGPDNHIIQPPKLIEAFGDEQAIETARRMVDGHPLEVWDQQRLVIRLEPRTGPEPI